MTEDKYEKSPVTEVPEELSDEDRLKRLAAAEEHEEVERERGIPPFGKL